MFNPTDFSALQWLVSPLLIFGRYAISALVLYYIFYGWKRRAWLYRKIQQQFPGSADLRREIAYSALACVFFAATIWAFLGTPLRVHTKFYTDIDTYGVWYLILSIPLTLIIHDTYFYWLHRLMHHPWLYRRVHLVHHLSVNPTPWAAYAFHPLEAILEAGIIPLLLVLMPLHPVSFFTFVTLMLWINIYGHLGYELFSRKAYQHPVGRWLNSSVHHNLHHERFHGNYGLYFIFWDRLMGTLRTDTDDKVGLVHERIEAAHAESPDPSLPSHA